MFGGDVPDVKRFGLVVDSGEHAIIGRDKIVLVAGNENGTARCADAGIDHDEVDGFRREIRIGLSDGDGAVKNIVSEDVMGDVDDVDFGIDAENHALHYADQVIAGAVVRRQSDDWARQVFPR